MPGCSVPCANAQVLHRLQSYTDYASGKAYFFS